MKKIIQEFKKHFPNIRVKEKLNKYSTFHIGGPADLFYIVKKIEEIPNLISLAKKNKIPFFIIGGGSNILFDDKGFRGLIIKIETEEINVKNTQITADSGVLISKLLKISIENKLTGLENWIGLPGTVGGAVYGNAGCNGLETKDILLNAEILDIKTGKIKKVDNKYFKFQYRHSKIKKSNEIILKATFNLKKLKTTTKKQEELIREIRKLRLKRQPPGSSTGSFFKNPSPDKPAGMLIDKAGLKGKTYNKAKISEKHANFILNTGGAKASDIIKLAKLAKKRVKDKFNIGLEEEVQILSEKSKIKLN